MFAVIELGGKQYLVREKDILRVEKLGVEAGKSMEAKQVLLVSDDKATHVGTPYLKTASVGLKLLSNGLGKKVRTFKMKAKKRYKRLKGHRQPYSDVEILKISA